MIIVTGATGQLGQTIVTKLLDRVPSERIVASCRDPQKASDLAALGVRVRQGDFAEPATLDDAFEGAEQILLVSSNARATGGDPLAQHTAAIEAAKRVGARRIVYTSQIAASATSAFPPARDHAATELMLSKSGIAWTALRHGFYGQSGIAMLDEALKTGTLETAEDGKFSWVAHDDLAEAASIILADEGKYDGPTQPLTGAESLDFSELAALASDIVGRTIEHQVLTDTQMREKVAARGAPASVADLVLGLYIAARNGEFAEVNPTLAELLGRPPMLMKELMVQQIVT